MKKEKKEEIKKKNTFKVILMSITNPWTIISIIIIVFCSICLIYENNIAKNYDKISVTYVKECDKYNICDNNYMYSVDNKNYGVSPKFETIEKYLKKNYAYYDKENPSDSIMISKWSYINILFIIVIIASSISYYMSLRIK